MSIEYQKQILKSKRTEKGLPLSAFPRQYRKYESGELSLGVARAETTYHIVKILDLSMDDLGKILTE